MSIWVQLEKEDWDWLRRVVNNSLTKAHDNPSIFCSVTPQIERVYAAIEQAMADGASGEKITVAEAVAEEKKANRKPRAKSGEGPQQPRLCEQHPTYGARRRPRNDCDTCWSLFEKYQGPVAMERACRKVGRPWVQKEEAAPAPSNGKSPAKVVEKKVTEKKVVERKKVTVPSGKPRGKKSRLTDEQVQEILTSPLKQAELAAKFGVSQPYISYLKRTKS